MTTRYRFRFAASHLSRLNALRRRLLTDIEQPAIVHVAVELNESNFLNEHVQNTVQFQPVAWRRHRTDLDDDIDKHKLHVCFEHDTCEWTWSYGGDDSLFTLDSYTTLTLALRPGQRVRCVCTIGVGSPRTHVRFHTYTAVGIEQGEQDTLELVCETQRPSETRAVCEARLKSLF